MRSFSYAIGDNSTIHIFSSTTSQTHLIGKFSIQDSENESPSSTLVVPRIGNVKLEFDENVFFSLIQQSTPLDTFFNCSTNYKLVNSFSKTVLRNALLTMPCPYVDHYNIFPSIQELIDMLTQKDNVKYYAIVHLDDDEYGVFIFDKV